MIRRPNRQHDTRGVRRPGTVRAAGVAAVVGPVREFRLLSATVGMDAEVRTANNGRGLIDALVARYDSLSHPLGSFRERIKPGAFRSALRPGADVVALWQHDHTRPLARTTAGTMRLRDSSAGLRALIEVPATTWGADAATAIRSGTVSSMSFGFLALDERIADQRSDDGLPIRELLEVNLFEVSPVTFPAYPETEVVVSG